MTHRLILVNKNDKVIGSEEKMTAHKTGKLHRAFSVIIYNSKQEMLLQQRSETKYHSGGLWSNACCSHPYADRSDESQIHNRLIEEMGFDCTLKWCFSFVYKHVFPNNLIEFEYDHVYAGLYDGPVHINASEIESYKWIDIDSLLYDIKYNSQKYTIWFRIIIENHLNDIADNILIHAPQNGCVNNIN